jgi:hypothetical protein
VDKHTLIFSLSLTNVKVASVATPLLEGVTTAVPGNKIDFGSLTMLRSAP